MNLRRWCALPWRLPLTLLILALGACAPTLSNVDKGPWTIHSTSGDRVRFELPSKSNTGRIYDGRSDGAIAGYPVHLEVASYEEQGSSVADSGVMLLITTLQFANSTCSPVDDAFLTAERAALEALPATTILSFRPETLSGLPGYVAEMTYGDFWSGKARLVVHATFGERTLYLLMTGFAEMPVDDAPGHAIDARLTRSFAVTDRPPPAAANTMDPPPGGVVTAPAFAAVIGKLRPKA